MQEVKVKEREEFAKIMADPVYKESLGLATVTDVIKYLKITPNTFYKWQGKLDKKPFDFDDFLKENEQEMAEAMLRQIKSGKCSPKTLELYSKLAGRYSDKREDTLKIEFSPVDYITAANRVVQTLREEYERTHRVCPVCNRPYPVVAELGMDTQPEHGEEGQVADVGLSGEAVQLLPDKT